MSAEMAQKLIQGGIKAVRNGDYTLARKAFTKALKLDPNNESAWLGMATITDAREDKLRILNRVLEINPNNTSAQETLYQLTADDASSELDAEFMEEDVAPIVEENPVALSDDETASSDDVTNDEDLEPSRSDDIFASVPQIPSSGTDGIPQLPQTALAEMGKQTETDVKAYLNTARSNYLDDDRQWTRKERGRVASSEYRVFLLQLGTAGFVALFIVLTGFATFLLSNPITASILLSASQTPSTMPTTVLTGTPGVTNTPSPTPDFEPSPTPELPFQATLGFDDPNVPSTPTQAYYPNSVNAISVPDETFKFINEGNLTEAQELLEEGRFIEEENGEFTPTYRLSQLYLINDEPDTARAIILEWQEEWQERDIDDYLNAESLILIGLARVDVYEVVNGATGRADLLDDAQNRLERALGLVSGEEALAVPDPLNPEAYVLLARTYDLRGDTEQALEIINNGLQLVRGNDLPLIGNIDMRMTSVRLLADARRYDEALQELYFVLEFDPFLEDALILQTELALESGQAGLAVLYAQQHLLYYPGSLEGLYLLGQAREAENKFDLALDAYSRAVAGDTSIEEYISDPFFLDNLLARATLLTRQGRRADSAEDFALAIELTGNNPQIQARSLASSYETGNYDSVVQTASDVLNESGVDRAEVLYYQGLALVAQRQAGGGTASNYSQAIDALEQALNSDLTATDRAIAEENLAIAHIEVGNTQDALDAINNALDIDATANRIYLRAQILDAQGNTDEALLDYEVIVTWGAYFNFPFLEDARNAYTRLAQSSDLR